MIYGKVKNGKIVLFDPIPPEWIDGREVMIESTSPEPSDDPADIEKWFKDLTALGPAQYEPGERDAIDALMIDADRQSKEQVRASWAQCNGDISS